MRQPPRERRSPRPRGSLLRRSAGSTQRNYESNGPSGKIRGTAAQIAERYQQFAQDALAMGDWIAAENLSQHAEHYLRLDAVYAMNEIAKQEQPFPEAAPPCAGGHPISASRTTPQRSFQSERSGEKASVPPPYADPLARSFPSRESESPPPPPPYPTPEEAFEESSPSGEEHSSPQLRPRRRVGVGRPHRGHFLTRRLPSSELRRETTRGHSQTSRLDQESQPPDPSFFHRDE